MKHVWIVVLAAFVLACAPGDVSTPEQSLYDVVENVSAEILYHDVFSDQIPSDEIVFFGVSFGDEEEHIVSLHGEPDATSEYQFGAIRNLEYGFGQENTTVVLYHLDRGVVSAVLVTNDANEYLVGETVMTGGRERVYGLLGIPTVTQDLHLERAFVYTELGYAFFITNQGIDRVYFSEPIPRDHDDEACAQVITPAVNPDGVCMDFATPCDVPSGWEVVDSCEGYNAFDFDDEQEVDEQETSNRPPQIFI